jgi:hypothetical protein
VSRRNKEQPWKQRFEIRQKTNGYFYVVDKADDRFVKNGTMYFYEGSAKIAASNYYRAEQRAIERTLFGDSDEK